MSSKINAFAAEIVTTPVYRVLEPRIAFDAALAATIDQAVSHPVADAHADAPAAPATEVLSLAAVRALTQAINTVDVVAATETASAPAMGEASAAAGATDDRTVATPTTTGANIVFIDAAVNDPAAIIAATPNGAEIVMLDATRDGLDQIAQYLNGRTGVGAIHILSHGATGDLILGNATIRQSDLAAHQADLAVIGGALAAGGDILLYGCDVAQGSVGHAFIAEIAARTGDDVAASTNNTGTATRGGDWVLEDRTGSIEAHAIDAPEWNGELAPLVISATTAPVITGSGGVGTTIVWQNAGTIGATNIDLHATITSNTSGVAPTFGVASPNGIAPADDPYILLNAPGSVTLHWEIFQAGSTTIHAVGTPTIQTTDIDGIGGSPFTRETVSPSLYHLSSYTLDNPTHLIASVNGAQLNISGTQDQNAEPTSLASFTWADVSSWDLTYTLTPNALTPLARTLMDGNGSLTFVNPQMTNILALDLDANNSTASGTAYANTFTEKGGAVTIADADLAITQQNALGPDLDSATITLTNAAAGDQLLVGTLPGGITSSIDTSVAGQIKVTLTGTTSVANYEAAIKAITFNNTSANPSTANRIIDIKVHNPTFDTTSIDALSTIHVIPVNDAPDGADKTITTLEGAAHTLTTADFGFTDVDGNALLAVKITTLPANGTLTDNGVAVTAGQTIALADITGGKLKWTPAANANGTGLGSFTFQVQDNGGTANGGVDLDQSPNTISFDVTPVNDAPVGADKTITTNEDAPVTLATADFGFSDPNDTPANALLGVKIDSRPANGTLAYNGVAITAAQITAGYTVTAADIAAGKLVWTPAANANGNGIASFTFQVQDNGGTANGGVDLDQSPNTLTFNVTAINDAPVGADKTITTLEDTPVTLTAATFGFTDPSDSPANALANVVIATLPATGSLELNGVAVQAGDVITNADIAAGKFKWTPAANSNGAGLASFTFQVQDNGGTANGGVDLDLTPNTITFDVTAVNDAPVGADKTVTTNEDTAVTLTTADFGFSDPNDTPANALLAIKITTLPANGTLTDNGVAVTAGQTIALADITGGKLKWTPAANANGTGLASFTFQVQDNGGTANGGVDRDQSPNTITFDVTAVNDAPVATGDFASGTAHQPITIDVLGNDADIDGTLNATSVHITGTAAPGLSLVVSGEGTWSVDTATGAITFTALPAFNGAPTPITYTVADDRGARSNAATVTVMPLIADPHLDLSGPSPYSGAFLYPHSTTPNSGGTANPALFATIGNEVAGSGVSLSYDGSSVNVSSIGGATLTDAIAHGDYISISFTTTAGLPETWIQNTVNRMTGATGEFAVALSTDGFKSATLLSKDMQASNYSGPFYDTPGSNYPWQPATDTKLAPATSYEMRVYFYNAPSTVVRWDDFYVFYSNDPVNFSTTFTEKGAAVAIATPTTEIEDTDNANVASSEVTLTNKQASDQLLVSGIVVSNGSTGTVNGIGYSVVDAAGSTTITLTGSATKSAYASALAAITFRNTSVTPDTTDRLINVTVNDGTHDSNLATTTIHVIAVNDAPDGADKTITTLEGAAHTLTTADFGFTDVDGNALLAVKITTLPANGTLTDNGVAVSAGQTIAIADITGGKLKWMPAANANGNGLASLTFRVQDNGGTANGGVDLDPTPNTITFDVTAVNDAPVGADKTVTTLEDTPVTLTTATFGFTDPKDTPTDSLLAVTITTLPTTGSLELNGVAVHSGDIIAAADIAAGKLVYTPAANANGTALASLTFQVQDNGGIANGGVDTSVTPNTITFDVTPVNDAPVAADKTMTTLEDTPVTLTTATFGFSDPNDTPADSLLAVTIVTLPATGSLELSGVAVHSGDIIAAADIAAGKLVYTPAADANGNGLASLTYQVQDNGGTANGGVDLDPTPNTITFDVTPVNDAPVAADDTGSVDRGQPLRIPVLANDSDVDKDLLTVILAKAEHGTVAINSDGTITYTPDWGFEGSDIIHYRISDGNGGFADAIVRLQITADTNARLPDAAAPQTQLATVTPERQTASGIVLDTVRGTTPNAANERLTAHGIVVDSVSDLSHEINAGTSRSAAAYEVFTLSNFSLKFTSDTSDPVVAIDTYVRKNLLIVQLGLPAFVKGDASVEWKVQRTDGRPMPDWLSFTGRSVLMGERAANEEIVDLRITAILPDGTTVSRDVRVMTPTGEMQPLRLGRQGQILPFWEQVPATPLLQQAQIENLGRFLMEAE